MADQTGAAPAFTLLGDHPCVTADDPLGFHDAARDLARLVLASADSTPFTLGIEAGWGMGKSSLMHQLEAQLRDDPRCRTVWFNAWSSEGHSVLEGLIKTVLDQIDDNILRRAWRRQRLVGWARVAFYLVAGWFHLGSVADSLWRQLSVDPRARNEAQQLMRDAMAEWTSRNSGAGDRLLVVFVDDLDRVSPDGVFQVFEAIKLYLEAKGFVFVIGYDASVVSEAVLEQKRYSKSVTGRDYLEKIIQIGYRIEQPDLGQARALMAAMLDEAGAADLFDDDTRTLVIERSGRNPRRIKRFANGFALTYLVEPDWRDLGAGSLVTVLALYTYYPEFMQLFDDRGDGPDPLQEFEFYSDVRDRLRLRQGLEPEQAERLASTYGVVVNAADPPAQTLEALERELPETFPRLVGEDGFRSLIANLAGSPRRDDLLAKLQRTGLRVATVYSEATATPPPTPTPYGQTSLTSLPVVWLSENGAPSSLLEAVREERAPIAPVTTARDAAARLIALAQPSVFVAEVPYGGDVATALAAAQEVRERWAGPIVLAALRVTPAMRDGARETGVPLAGGPEELVALLRSFAPPPPTPPNPPSQFSPGSYVPS